MGRHALYDVPQLERYKDRQSCARHVVDVVKVDAE